MRAISEITCGNLLAFIFDPISIDFVSAFFVSIQ